MSTRKPWLLVCESSELVDRCHVGIDLLYDNEVEAVVVFRFDGEVYAYINRCVHMQQRLDRERDSIFDDSGQLLRCSMHGLVYEPASGTAVGTRCNGERLRPVRVREQDGNVYITDKRAWPLPTPRDT